jgi:hypothetical protein
MAGGNGKRIGLALGEREITGVLLGKNSSVHARVPIAPDPDSPELTLDLGRACKDLKAELERGFGGSLAGASVYVAILPPLADVRLVPLPHSMQKSEVEAVLNRGVSRYFLGANRPRVVGVRTPRRERRKGKDGGDSPASVLAAAVSLALLEQVRSAVAGTGWVVRSFSAAHQAWLDAAASLAGSPVSGVVAVVGSTAHTMSLEGPDPWAVRQLPASDPAAVAEAVGGGSGSVLVLDGSKGLEEIGSALTQVGATPVRDPGGWPGVEELTAAKASAPGLELVPPSLSEERREKGRRGALRLGFAAAALLIATLGVNFLGARRELAAVRAERASIRADVAPLLLVRDSLDALRTQVRSLEEISQNSPVWTRSLVELTGLLPENTYLTGFFASGDTVELEAAGAEAGPAIQALRGAGLFEEVRLQGLVERELEEGETVEERFTLWARLPASEREGGGT